MRQLLIFVLMLGTAASARSESILVVGDSLTCGHFGNNLIADLTSQGHQVKVYCAVGSRPEHWLDGRPARASWPCEIHTFDRAKVSSSAQAPHVEAIKSQSCGGFPKFSRILSENPSDRVIVALGTNSLPGNPDATYDRMIDAVSSSRRSCTWILPPHLEPGRASTGTGQIDLARKDGALGTAARPGPFYQAMNRKLSGRCGSIASLASTERGTPGNATGEGLHQTKAAGRYRYLTMKRDITRALTTDTVDRTINPTTGQSRARSRN